MQFLTKEQIKQPKGRFIPPPEETHLFGGTETIEQLITAAGLVPTIVNPSGDWTDYCTDFDYQRLADGEDTDECVTASHLNALMDFLQGVGRPVVKRSRRFTALDSGTTQGVGNTSYNVQQSIIHRGSVAETDCPSDLPDLKTFFQKLLPAVYKKEDYLASGEVPHFIAIPNALIADALKYGLVVSAVSGYYGFNELQQVVRNSDVDNHYICIPKSKNNMYDYYPIQDSENPGGFIQFASNYRFDYCYLVISQKKNMPKIYKLKTDPALFALDPLLKVLVPFLDGVVPGGEVFKTEYGADNYSVLPRVKDAHGNDWDKLPFPVANWAMTSVAFDPSKYNS